MRALTLQEMMILPYAALWTVGLSAAAFIGGIILGSALAAMRIADARVLRWPAMAFIRVFQGTPPLLQLFLVFFGSEAVGIPLGPWPAAVLGLSLHSGAFLGEIWRSSINTVPVGQWEASAALGLRYVPRMLFVIIPSAIPIAIAPTVGFLVHLVKTTSLATLLGVAELTRAGQALNNTSFRPFLIFGVVSLIYFALCWPLSELASRFESRRKRIS